MKLPNDRVSLFILCYDENVAVLYFIITLRKYDMYIDR